jgi:hypothetical protein
MLINATYLIMTGNSLELKIRLINWKLLIIGRVMTSLIVITLEIGQSAGKEPNFVMTKIWFSLNDVEIDVKIELKYIYYHIKSRVPLWYARVWA